MNPSSTTMDYVPGNSYIFMDSVDLYAIWTISLSNLNWKKDFIPSVSTINVVDTGTQTKIDMVGNQTLPGKGATWTSLDSSAVEILDFEFNYNIDFGDSFNAGGILFNVIDSNPSDEHSGTLEGYMISFNNAGIFRTGKTSNLWKFTYNKGQNSTNFDNSTLKKKADFALSKTGSMTIKVTPTGYDIYNGATLLYHLLVPNSEEPSISKNANSFGFFSDHYSHNCSRIGSFIISNINIHVDIH